jgi:glyoxylase-like metal-dependent hydrolase (beta-lactamase superfamily II)
MRDHRSSMQPEARLIHEVLPVGALGCNCSILGDPITREAIVVDPGDDIGEIVAILDRHPPPVKTIAITHAHIDHIGGAHKLRALTGAPVYMNQSDAFLADNLNVQAAWLGVETPENPGIDTLACEGDVLRAGSIEAHVLHTPGHTPGSISLYLPAGQRVIAGDTLFKGSIGRTDLPGGDFNRIAASIRGKLYTLPEATIVYPGHGETTDIATEKRSNPFVRG